VSACLASACLASACFVSPCFVWACFVGMAWRRLEPVVDALAVLLEPPELQNEGQPRGEALELAVGERTEHPTAVSQFDQPDRVRHAADEAGGGDVADRVVDQRRGARLRGGADRAAARACPQRLAGARVARRA